MATRWFSVVIDCTDVRAQAAWWASALRWTTIYESDDEVVVIPPGEESQEGVPGLVFVPVSAPKTAKNRIHLDLKSESSEDQAAIVERLVAAGATHVDIGQGDVSWVVLADPEGNELCVLAPNEHYDGPGAVAAVVVDAVDPDALAAFWVEASGRQIGFRTDDIVELRHPDGLLPHLEIGRTGEPHTVKNRFHLDTAPWPDDDQADEVARLVALGATPIDVGQGPDVTWTVLADPEGNEFCVLRPR